jgi:uncharacterized surface protein with fasciclin (FAS1) repeats
MHKRFNALFLMLLMIFSAAFTVSAQDATPEPTAEATADAVTEVQPEVTVVPEIEAPPSDNNTYLRLAHFSPETPTVDVYLNDMLAITGLTYLNASAWIPLTPESYSVAVVPTGGSVSEALIPAFEVSASAGTWHTVALVGSVANGTLHGALIGEDYSELLPGTGGFTFINAVEGEAPVNLIRDDVVYYAQIAFPEPNSTSASSSLRVDSGVYDVAITATDDPNNILFEQTQLELTENVYTLVALVGTPGNESLVTISTDEANVAIARGLLPKPGTLMDALGSSENLTAFANALGSGELAGLLSDEGDVEYTIFAPASFVLDGMSMDETALMGYVVAGKYPTTAMIAAGTLTALDGSTLTITTAEDGIYVNGVLVIDVNIPATNGIIHLLNGTFAPAE